jgi:S-(hydroxymethyl)glutathione dehydrogenase/alcohol dehydrogenase
VGAAGDVSGVEELRLLPIEPRQVLIRTEASGPCYTMVLRGLPCGTPSVTPAAGAPGADAAPGGGAPTIDNHCGVGTSRPWARR